MKEKIRKWNRTVLELVCGILFWGLLCQVSGVWFVKDPISYSVGLWIGIMIAILAGLHMYISLDRAFSEPAGNVARRMTVSNLFRYVAIVAVFALVVLSGIGNPILTFVGIMGLKVGAYLQPLTHKLTNRYFQESDPIPQPLEEVDETIVEGGE